MLLEMNRINPINTGQLDNVNLNNELPEFLSSLADVLSILKPSADLNKIISDFKLSYINRATNTMNAIISKGIVLRNSILGIIKHSTLEQLQVINMILEQINMLIASKKPNSSDRLDEAKIKQFIVTLTNIGATEDDAQDFLYICIVAVQADLAENFPPDKSFLYSVCLLEGRDPTVPLWQQNGTFQEKYLRFLKIDASFMISTTMVAAKYMPDKFRYFLISGEVPKKPIANKVFSFLNINELDQDTRSRFNVFMRGLPFGKQAHILFLLLIVRYYIFSYEDHKMELNHDSGFDSHIKPGEYEIHNHVVLLLKQLIVIWSIINSGTTTFDAKIFVDQTGKHIYDLLDYKLEDIVGDTGKTYKELFQKVGKYSAESTIGDVVEKINNKFINESSLIIESKDDGVSQNLKKIYDYLSKLRLDKDLLPNFFDCIKVILSRDASALLKRLIDRLFKKPKDMSITDYKNNMKEALRGLKQHTLKKDMYNELLQKWADVLKGLDSQKDEEKNATGSQQLMWLFEKDDEAKV